MSRKPRAHASAEAIMELRAHLMAPVLQARWRRVEEPRSPIGRRPVVATTAKVTPRT